MKLRHALAVVLPFALVCLRCANGDQLIGAYPGGDGGDPDGYLGFGDGGGPEATTGGCSGDLQHVIDSNGNVILDCPPDQGCYGGACIPACDAAGKSQSSIGCDFVVPTPAYQWAGDTVGQPCYAIYLANNWDDNLGVTVEYDGTMLDPAQFVRVGSDDPDPTKWSALGASGLTPGQVGILFMSSDPTATETLSATVSFPENCAVAPAVGHDTTIPNVAPYKGRSGIGKAFHIRTTRPVSAYDILPFGGATSFITGAELLLPTTAWSSNYVVTTSPGDDNCNDPMNPDGPCATCMGDGYLQVVATQDGTHIQVAVNKNLDVGWMGYTYINPAGPELPPGPSVASAPAGMVTSYTLNAGEYIQWFGAPFGIFLGSIPQESTGTVFSSDKPIGVFAGDSVMDIGRSDDMTGAGTIARAADGERHQIVPVGAMGSEYLAAPYPTRRDDLALEKTLYRLMAFTNGTTFTFDPPIPTGPVTLDAGQHQDFVTTQAFVVRSQDKNHPFYIAQMMSGAEANPKSRPGVDVALATKMSGGSTPMYGTLGDPDFLPLIPPVQFINHYAFYTDPTYATTSLVITRAHGTDGKFADVTVDCLGAISGWVPLGSDGRFEYAIVDLVRARVNVGTCKNGPHSAKSTAPFGLYVWGVDFYVSYSYPVGGSVARVNDVVVPPVPVPY